MLYLAGGRIVLCRVFLAQFYLSTVLADFLLLLFSSTRAALHPTVLYAN